MKYDVIVVLAGGIEDSGKLPETVKRRILVAKKLYDQKLAPLLLMSGRWSRYRENHLPPRTEAAAMKEYAVELGIPSAVIFKEEQSNSTLSNAVQIKKQFLDSKKWKKIIVITSDFHIPRTRSILNKIWGSTYHIRYEAASSPFNILRWMRWYVGEKLLHYLDAHRLP